MGWIVFIIILIFLSLPASAQTSYTITDLGPGGAYGINNADQVVGGATDSFGNEHAVLWSNGQMQYLGATFGGLVSRALGINNAGQVVGYDENATACIWSNGQEYVLVSGSFGGYVSNARGINDAGEVAGFAETSTSNGATHACLWSNGQEQDLGTLGGPHSNAYGINDLGQVVGWSFTAAAEEPQHAFLWSGGIMYDLGTLGGTNSYAYGINDVGQVVGQSQVANGDWHAFLWSPGNGMQDLGLGSANGINNKGQVVGYDGNGNAFLWSQGNGMQDLGPGSANGINDVGQAVGVSYSNGHAVIWTPASPGFLYFKDADNLSREVIGTVCDGTSQIQIQLVIGAPSNQQVTFSIVSDDSKHGQLIGSNPMNFNNNTATITYLAPMDYPFSDATIQAAYSNITVQRALSIKPCPVVLVHGIWSSSATWTSFGIFSTGINPQAQLEQLFPFVYAVNYKSSNAQPFSVNAPQVPIGIAGALLLTTSSNYVAKKADVVAHSMGGVLTRWYLEDLTTPKYQNNIRRIITIGTPHSGTQLASKVVALGYPDAWVAQQIGMPVNQGAVENMSVNSFAIDSQLNLPSNLSLANSRAVVSSVYVDVGSLRSNPPSQAKALAWYLGYSYGPFQTYSTLCMESLFLPETTDDYLVPASSQQGGLSGNQSAFYQGFWHIDETSSSSIVSRVSTILLSPLSAGYFSTQGFNPPTLTFSSMAIRPMVSPQQSIGTVTITSPTTGTILYSNDTFYATVTVSGDVQSILVGTYFDSSISNTFPYQYPFIIPSDAIGSFYLVAAGEDSTGTIIAVDSVLLNIQLTATVEGINILGSLMALYTGDTSSLTVMGNFSDSIQRDISQNAGTIFTSNDTTIVSVDSVLGIMYAISTGQTFITATNNGYFGFVNVTVLNPNPNSNPSPTSVPKEEWMLYSDSKMDVSYYWEHSLFE